MKLQPKFLLTATIIFLTGNLLIFINRNKGFEYKKVSSLKELYPSNPDNSFLNKWIRYNLRFSSAELNQGLTLLNKTIRIDTISNEERKIICIGGWLYNSFRKQVGIPDDSMAKLSPLQQYHYLLIHKEKQLWCGNFQGMFGFFCAAVMLPNRYVEIAPMNNNTDTHEVNEVYLSKIKKWVMIDVTRNFLLIRKNDQLFSTAEYLEYKLQHHEDGLFFSSADTSSVNKFYISPEINSADVYFNENHFLRYYHTLDLSKVYAFWPKIKRYFLAEPWYEMYVPGNRHSNFLFRVKQFFLFGMGTVIIVILYYNLRPKNRVYRIT
jgi:hypothetical protein